MKISISNIAWEKEYDKEMYEYISKAGFDAIEIAPTRIIEEKPYDHINQAIIITKEIEETYGLKISSMQSIWYGRNEKIFESLEERKELLNYTKNAIDFAEAINCKNLVFGCPKNRIINDIKKDYQIALDFFNTIGNYANEKSVCFSIEPNPTIYNTNFITKTMEAIELVKQIDNPGIKVNLDLGTIIQNNEDISILNGNVKYINHVHISEPNLECIRERNLHKDLINLLKVNNYNGYISIEMKNQNNIQNVKNAIDYVFKLVKGD